MTNQTCPKGIALESGFIGRRRTMCKSNPKWAKHPCFAVIHPGPKGRPHSGSCLPTSGSFKKQNEPNFPFFNRKSNLEPRKSQNEPKVGEASLLRCHSPRPEGTSSFWLLAPSKKQNEPKLNTLNYPLYLLSCLFVLQSFNSLFFYARFSKISFLTHYDKMFYINIFNLCNLRNLWFHFFGCGSAAPCLSW
jgi:hypothetical protein